MAMDIGPRLGIEGEKEFRNAISQINTSLKTLDTEMAAVTSAFAKGEKSEQSLTAQNEVLNRQLEEQRKKLEQLQAGLAQSADKYGAADEKTQKWQQAVNKATADLNNLERQLSDNNSALESAGKGLGEAGSAAADAGDKAEDSAGKWDKLRSGLSGIGSAAAKGVKALAAAAASAAAGLGAMAVKGAYAADDINTLSKQTGISVEEIQKFQFASEQIDVSFDTLAGSMSKLTKNMSTARKGTGDAADAFSSLGISITDSNGELRSNQEVFDEAIDALGRMENETQRDAAAMQIFGKSARELNPLILGGSEALKELGDQAEAAGIILGQDALNNANRLSDAIDTFKATLKGSGNLFSTALAGPMADGINQVTGYLNQLTTAFNAGGFAGLSQELSTVVTSLVTDLTASLPKVTAFGLDIVRGIVGGISENLPLLMEGATQVITLLGKLGEGLMEAVPQLLLLVPKVIGFLFDAFQEQLDKVKSIGKNIVQGVWSGITSMYDWFKEKVKGFFTGIVNSVKSMLGIESPSKVFAGIGKNMALGLGEGFSTEMKGVAAQIQNSVPTNLSLGQSAQAASSALGEGLVNGLAAILGSQQGSGGPIVIQVPVDGKVVAQAVFDPLKGVARQKGVAYG